MTDEQIRLYAIARCVVPSGSRIRTFCEPIAAGNGKLYTLEIWPEDEPTRRRWFAIHGNVFNAYFPDDVIAEQIRFAISRPSASPDPAG